MGVIINFVGKCIAKLILIFAVVLTSPFILIWVMAMGIDRMCNYNLGVYKLNKKLIIKTGHWLKYEIKRRIDVLNRDINELNEKLKKLEKLNDEENTDNTI